VAEEFGVVDVWLCRFASAEAADAYFEETYEEDDDGRPISPFAADMGERFYDHDFVERGDFHDPPINDVAGAVARHSFSSSYLAAVVEAFRAKPVAPFNMVLLVWNREIERPVSVAQPGRTLHYLGRFGCDPKAGSSA
jgi:hypothetical protein